MVPPPTYGIVRVRIATPGCHRCRDRSGGRLTYSQSACRARAAFGFCALVIASGTHPAVQKRVCVCCKVEWLNDASATTSDIYCSPGDFGGCCNSNDLDWREVAARDHQRQ